MAENSDQAQIDPVDALANFSAGDQKPADPVAQTEAAQDQASEQIAEHASEASTSHAEEAPVVLVDDLVEIPNATDRVLVAGKQGLVGGEWWDDHRVDPVQIAPKGSAVFHVGPNERVVVSFA